MGHDKLKYESLTKVSGLDKTSVFNKYFELSGKNEDISGLDELITNELAYESYLDLAIKMYKYGFLSESIQILKTGPEYPLLYLWLAYLDEENQNKWLESALGLSPAMVFPLRDETMEVLQHFISINDNWKLKYYAGLIFWKKGLIDKAKVLFDQCGEVPDYAPFYLAKAELFDDRAEIVKGSLLKAREIDGESWRVDLAMSKMYMSQGEYSLAEEITGQALKKKPERLIIGLNYGISLLNQGKYKQCMSFLESFELIPFEGAVVGRNVYHEAAVKAAFEEIRKKNYKKAIIYAEKALLWPENLGSGKPYDPDERLDNFVLAYCNEKLGRDADADTFYSRVSDYALSGISMDNPLLHLQILSLENTEGTEAAQKLLEKASNDYPDSRYIKWITDCMQQEVSESDTNEMIRLEKQESPINNNFLLINDLLLIINGDD